MSRPRNPQLLLLVLVVIVMTVLINAEVPQLINYQGRLTDDTGQLVADGGYQITFKIWNWESGGTLLWNSGPQTVSTIDGLFSYQLGSAVQLPNSLFTDSTRWLSMEVEGDPEITPRTRLITVPYAYQSLRSDTADYAHSASGNGGDITAVYASTGLDGGGETGDVTLSIADGGVSGLQIASAAISAGKIQENAVWSDHILDGSITFDDINQNSASTDQIMKWNGSAWVAANDETGSGGVSVEQLHDTADVVRTEIRDTALAIGFVTNIALSDTAAAVRSDIRDTASILGFTTGVAVSDTANAVRTKIRDTVNVVVDATTTLDSTNISTGGISFSDIHQNTAASDQVMKWNGSAWAAADDETGSGGNGWTDDGSIVRLETAADNIGIGTTTPGGHKLFVTSSGSSVPGATSLIQNTAADGIGLMIEANSTDLPLLVSQLGDGPILRCDSYTGGWHPAFTIENDGRTKIGSASFTSGLEIYGDGKINDSILTFDNDGVRIGDGGDPIFSTLLQIERGFDTHDTHYGLNSHLTNESFGELCGVYSEVERTYSGTTSYEAYGIQSICRANLGSRYGIYSRVHGNITEFSGYSYGINTYASCGINAYGIYASANYATTNYAGYFNGDVNVTGTLSKGGGSFKIDHPLDPENKYLQHSFIESPDMMNVYNGNVLLGNNGEATVELPEYFNALNKDFRYQLTCIGGYAPVYIADEISGNQFRIAGGEPGMKVSWMVTGIRKDAWANVNRIQVEVEKPENEKGLYLHPEALGFAPEKQIHYEQNKRHMER